MFDKPITHTSAEKQFLHTYTAGAMLPLTQASITALLVFVGSLVIGYFVFDIIDPMKPAIILAVIAWIGTWLSRQRMWTYLATFERVTGLDINNDGVIGDVEDKPKRDPIIVRIDEVNNGHYKSNTHEFPDWLTDAQLEELAHGLINLNRPFSRREWTTRSRLFSEPQYHELQSFFIRHGLIEASGKTSHGGFELTNAGRAAMTEFADVPPSPTEDAEMVVE